MSLGGGVNTGVNNAVDAAVNAGFTMVVAAGNNGDDACKYSPASALLAITVGASTTDGEGSSQVDERSIFSNFGACVDIFAPGTQITSTYNNGGIRVLSGTSMAAPHVAGVGALYFEMNPSGTPATFLADVTDNGSRDKINLNCGSNAACRNSPNVLCHSSCDIGM